MTTIAGEDARYLHRREWPGYIREKHGLLFGLKTFGKLGSVGGGPRYVLFANRAYSTAAWLDEWVASKLSEPRHSTSEAA